MPCLHCMFATLGQLPRLAGIGESVCTLPCLHISWVHDSGRLAVLLFIITISKKVMSTQAKYASGCLRPKRGSCPSRAAHPITRKPHSGCLKRHVPFKDLLVSFTFWRGMSKKKKRNGSTCVKGIVVQQVELTFFGKVPLVLQLVI